MQKNPEAVRTKTLRRRARKVGAEGSHTTQEWLALCARSGNKCLRCEARGVSLTRDHVVSLVMGGTNYIDNLQPLCIACNAKKDIRSIDYRKVPVMHEPTNSRLRGQASEATHPQRRFSLREAAARLGVSGSAIRKRVERGTLRSDKGPDGKRYVYLDTGADTMADTGADKYERDALISSKDETIAVLRQQLEAERQSSAELRRIVAALTSRIPELPAASSERPPEGPVTTTDKPESDTSARSEESAQEGAQRPWWRRWFGG
jgi:hypothetical protein